jgi:hypothetical protein
MSLIGLVLTLAIVGFILWLIVTYIPMPAPFKQIILVVVIIVVLLWLLSQFGVLGSFTAPIRIGR